MPPFKLTASCVECPYTYHGWSQVVQTRAGSHMIATGHDVEIYRDGELFYRFAGPSISESEF